MRCLGVCYGGGHSKIISAILDEGSNYSDINFKIIALTTAWEDLKAYNNFNNIEVVQLSHFKPLFKDFKDEISQIGNELLIDLGENSKIEKDESAFYLGLSMLDLIQKIGEKKAYLKYESNNRGAFLQTISALKIITAEMPDIVFATNSPRFEKALILAAKKKNIFTFQINDLFAEEAGEIISDNIITMNHHVAKDIISLRPYSNCVPLGQPALENSISKINEVKRDKKNDGLRKTQITWFTQKAVKRDNEGKIVGFYDQRLIIDEYFSLFKKILNKNPQLQISIRVHPSESQEFYESIFSDIGVSVINSGFNIYESIAFSDIILVDDSTVGVEGVLAGKTVLTYRKFGEIHQRFKRPPFINLNSTKEIFEFITRYERSEKRAPQNKFELTPNASKNIINWAITEWNKHNNINHEPIHNRK